MPNFGITASNLAWMGSCFPAFRSFRQALRDPQATQARVLNNILTRNATSEFGCAHGFSAIRRPSGITSRPSPDAETTYDDLASFINRIRTGEENVLTTEPVRLFERTSGSSSAAKYIPYTDFLRQEFQSSKFAPWIFRSSYRNDTRLYRDVPTGLLHRC